jgi:hypothetical protein
MPQQCGLLAVVLGVRELKPHRQWLHAYSNNRLSKIEITIDPIRPRPLEKKKNMLAQRPSVSASSE